MLEIFYIYKNHFHLNRQYLKNRVLLFIQSFFFSGIQEVQFNVEVLFCFCFFRPGLVSKPLNSLAIAGLVQTCSTYLLHFQTWTPICPTARKCIRCG